MTNSAQELLLHQSVEHLLTARYPVEAAFDERMTSDVDPGAGRDLGFALFTQINQLLKLALELDDRSTFSEVERRWAAMFDDLWLPDFPREGLQHAWLERRGGAPPPELMSLLRRREVLRFGLVMWATHLLERPHDQERRERLVQGLGQLASRFDGVEWVLDAFDAASEDESGPTPWTDWFLGELPTEEAHFIPTRPKLLWAALLLAARSITPEAPPALRPRQWFVWRQEEIGDGLSRLEREREQWQSALGLMGPFGGQPEGAISDPPASWSSRVARLRELFERGAEEQKREEAQAVREAPIDEARVAELRDRTLAESAQSRVLRDTLKQLDQLAELGSPPDDHEPRVSRSWAPRSIVTADSRVVGLDMMARDLARPMRDAERQQLLQALPEIDSTDPGSSVSEGSEGEVAGVLHRTIAEMRKAGYRPTLIVLPMNWRLQRAIGLSGFGAIEVEHPLVPPGHSREFCGVFEDILALDLARMPEDRIWAVDLGSAIRFEEWPSEGQSGLEFELQGFNQPEQAAAFLKENPEVAAADASPEDTIELLQERVLITLRLCWRIRSRDPNAARAVAVPHALQRED